MVVVKEFQNGDQPRNSFVKNDKGRSGCRHPHHSEQVGELILSATEYALGQC